MGIGRKVGAFLGLVPEEQHGYTDEDGYVDHANHPDDFEDHRAPDYRRGPSRDADDGYRAEDYRGADHRGDDHRAGGYAPDEHEYPAQAPTYEPLPRERGGRQGGSRGFAAEPVVQGALAVKSAPFRRDSDAGHARPAAVKLTGFGEARVIGEKYRDGQSVILDMTEMADADARRLVDFSAGLAFSMRGSIEKVAPKVFMLLPPNADSDAGLLADARAYAGR